MTRDVASSTRTRRSGPDKPAISGALSRRFGASLRAGDGANASVVIGEASDHGLSEVEIYIRVITPAMVEIGELWASGVVSVTQERMASMITISQLERLRVRPQIGATTDVVVLAAGAREDHTIGLLMVRNLCESGGYQTLLGDTAEPEKIAATVSARRPVLVGLTAAVDRRLPSVFSVIARVRQALPEQPILLGGRAGQIVAGSLGCDLAALRRTESAVEIAELLAPLLSRPDGTEGSELQRALES